MAVFKSTIFSQIVNSVSGVTFYTNSYGSIIGRTRVVPADPQTIPQVAVRALFSAAMAAWQGMTATQRQSWEDFAVGTPWKNAVGDDVHLSGVNMYLSIRLAALKINALIPVATFDLAPCLPGLFPQEHVRFEPCTSGILQTGFQIEFINHHPTKHIKIGFHMSTAQNTTVNFWKGPYHDRSYFATASVPPGLLFQFPKIGLTLGKRYFFRMRVLNDTDQNLVSSPWHASAVAASCVS